MSWLQFIILFSCLWWVVLFCALPYGIERAKQHEGHKAPPLYKKIMFSTIIAMIITLLAREVMQRGWL